MPTSISNKAFEEKKPRKNKKEIQHTKKYKPSAAITASLTGNMRFLFAQPPSCKITSLFW